MHGAIIAGNYFLYSRPHKKDWGWISANYVRHKSLILVCFSSYLFVHPMLRFYGCVGVFLCVGGCVCSGVPVPKSPRLYSHSSPVYQCWLIKATIPTASWTMLTPLMVPWPMTPGWVKGIIAISTLHLPCQGWPTTHMTGQIISVLSHSLPIIASPLSTPPLFGLR